MKKDKDIKNNRCFYCGEAPVNHFLYKIENFITSVFEPHMLSVANHAPKFLKDFADFIPVSLLKILIALGLARFSSDIEKANSFRSKVIWEEAKRRNIHMDQVVLGNRYIDWYRAFLNGKTIYFESIPIQSEFLESKMNWDDKIILKNELKKNSIPVPDYEELSIFSFKNLNNVFSKFNTPVIIKPKLGSRARHTVTNISNIDQFKLGIKVARKISTHLVIEEHLYGSICRATIVGGVLAGFYSGTVPTIRGDGNNTIAQLIQIKNHGKIKKYHILLNEELTDHILRLGFTVDDILPKDKELTLSHRRGQLFGGDTKEMIDELHPSFVPILEKAARVTGLSVLGFDCIIPDPTKDESAQRWGIIECNTLPFIDMHYYALEGKPRNIAGMIWDLWGN